MYKKKLTGHQNILTANNRFILFKAILQNSMRKTV